MRWHSPGSAWTQWPRAVFVAVLDLVYPRDCTACGTRLTGTQDDCFCEQCLQLLQRIGPEQCPRCGDQLGPFADGSRACRSCGGTRTLVFRRATAVFRYEGSARTAVHRLKYSRDLHTVRWMAREIASKLRSKDWFDSVDVVVPVPLHLSRRVTRRFNQSEVIARRVARLCGKPLLGNILRRTQRTASQTSLDRSQREQNVRGAFRMTSPKRVTGKIVLLVDDVMTTCATATECSRALVGAGARGVYVAVLAR